MSRETIVSVVGGPGNLIEFEDWESMALKVSDGREEHGDESGALYFAIGNRTVDLDLTAQGALGAHIIANLTTMAAESVKRSQESVALKAMVRLGRQLEAASTFLLGVAAERIMELGSDQDRLGVEQSVGRGPREVSDSEGGEID